MLKTAVLRSKGPKKAKKHPKMDQNSWFMFTDMPTCLNFMLFIICYLGESYDRKSGLYR